MQTIIGAGGAIGTPLAQELPKYTNKIRLVSRNPKKVNESDELFPADVTNAAQIDKAVEGSEVVYITVGFDYDINVWRSKWPPFVKSVIEACKKHNAKLVFFDNVYMYDKSAIPHMTEESPLNPPSEKGKVRRQIADMIMDEVKAGKLTALIARAADFYGPKNDKSILLETIHKNFKEGKAATPFGSDKTKHTYTYTIDAGKATALLGNTPDAYNQVWHVPTDPNGLTAKQWVEMFAKEMGVKPKYNVAGKFLVRILGVFIPIMREFPEMIYQYELDYFLDSSKFNKRFPDFKTTTYAEGLKEVVKAGR
jgi:nucleoside-diphosphate-sugar epimerase